MLEHEEIMAALRLSRSRGVGAAAFKKLMAAFGSPLKAEEFVKTQPLAARVKSATEEGIEKAEVFLHMGGHVLVFGHDGYPETLRALSEPPPVLFVSGNPGVMKDRLVAIIGSRDCSEKGRLNAREAAAIVATRAAVVSGGARGIDGEAHAACLECQKPTVGVLGNGVDVVYPRENAVLFEEIVKTGALVSELLPGTPPAPGFFPTRNRIIAGLASGVILIEGKRVSGSLSTARWAMKLGRPVACPLPEKGDRLGEAARLLQERGAHIYSSARELESWIAGLPFTAGDGSPGPSDSW